MYVHGEFINKKGDVVAVHILTNGDRTEEMEIGTEESGLWFPAESPVVIEDEVNDTFDVLLRQSAKVTLLCRDYVPGFFCTSALSAVVNIYRGGECVFAGFLEPQTYSQPYNDVQDELELNCLDALSGLQYMNYKSVGALGVVYETVRSEAGQRTFGEVVMEALRGVSDGLDILAHLEAPEEGDSVETVQDEEKGDNFHVWFDGSKSADKEGSEGTAVFSDLGVTDLLFMGDGADSVWQQSTVVEEVLKYLNLHIRQDGFDFYIFDWATVKGNGAEGATWYALNGDEAWKDTARLVTLSADNVEGCDAEISIGEVYNQLLLTAVMERAENAVENPLDSESLTNVYDGMQKYMTEYITDIDTSSKEEGQDEVDVQRASFHSFADMVKGLGTTYKDSYISDWYIRLKRHAHWVFPMGDWQPIEGKKPKSADEDLTAYAHRNGAGQNKVLNWIGDKAGKGCLLAYGGVKTCQADSDNRPVRPTLENGLMIGVANDYLPTGRDAYDIPDITAFITARRRRIASELRANRPCAIYTNINTSAAFSPSDDAITNYMVLSGRMVLSQYPFRTGDMKDLESTQLEGTFFDKAVFAPESGYRYYTQQFWDTADPMETPSEDLTVTGTPLFTGEQRPRWQYSVDTITGEKGEDYARKIPVLACMLIIGDKCVVETGDLGVATTFEWRPYKTREECGSDDEYYAQCFYVGFDPAAGDKLAGVEYDLQNTITSAMGVDAEGVAIPMRKSDRLSGTVRFVIVGPVSVRFDDAEKKVVFYEESASSKGSYTMDFVNSVILKEFEVKVYSDSGRYDSGEEKDVVYMSNTKERFVNRKEDIEMKINSALTAAECRSMGVANSVNVSTPINAKSGVGVLTIYDRCGDEEAKAEHLYVDRYWNEYHKPRILLEQCVRDGEYTTRQLTHYKHPALKKEFYVQGYGRDLMEGTVTLKLKESGE